MLDEERLLVVGGFDRSGASDTSEVAAVAWAFREGAGHYDVERVVFSPGPRMARRRGGCAVAQLDAGHALVVGGSDGSSRLRSTEVLRVESMSFGPGPEMGRARSGAALARFHRSRLLVAGGLGTGLDGCSDGTEVLDVESMRFKRGPCMGARRAYCTAVLHHARPAGAA
mmetsp:Transcript_12349/g.37215  ORF Transcript_12349/g.37215 Transcript_12349/m.37215 type:complete len:170 (-) Transcript_12349:290-799(-)